MQIVIDIPEMTLLNITSRELLLCSREDIEKLEFAIKNGVSLPKGHGRLIDANVLCDCFWDNRSKLYTHKDLQIVIDRADTIIEAEREG